MNIIDQVIYQIREFEQDHNISAERAGQWPGTYALCIWDESKDVLAARRPITAWEFKQARRSMARRGKQIEFAQRQQWEAEAKQEAADLAEQRRLIAKLMRGMAMAS